MELAKWTFPIISLCREPYEAKVSRTGLTGGMGRRTVRQRALCLPSQAVYRGKEESKKPNGEGKQVSQRKGRRGTRDAKSRNDPERIERETGEPDDAKVSCPVRGGLVVNHRDFDRLKPLAFKWLTYASSQATVPH